MTAPRENIPYDFAMPFQVLVRRGFERAHGRKPEPGELGQAWRVRVEGADLVATWAAAALVCPYQFKPDHIPPVAFGDGYWKASACAGPACGWWRPITGEYGCCREVERTPS
jgi:hypothetical protein